MMALSKRFNKPGTGTLFPMKGEFWIHQLTGREARLKSDHFTSLRNLIVANEPMYPSIGNWFDSKVVAGVKSSERLAYIAYEGGKPVASAVLKRGEHSKFCHLRINEEFQDRGLGDLFFLQMTMEIRRLAMEIHFTLPESLWTTKKDFFHKFGFKAATKASRQYRHGDTELVCSASLGEVWSAALERLPYVMTRFSVAGYSLDNAVILSIRPKYASQVLNGSKLIEVRRRFSKRLLGLRASLYASRPVGALVGEATMNTATYGPPEDIWADFGRFIGCEKAEFDAYTKGRCEVAAIELSDILPYKDAIPLERLSHIMKEDLRPPQSYRHINLKDNNPWARAVLIAAFLHGRFGFVNRKISEQPRAEDPADLSPISTDSPGVIAL